MDPNNPGDPPELRPGFASAEAVPEDPAPPADLHVAHYGGMDADEATATWERETLCTTCLLSPMCTVAAHTEAPRILIQRCLAYLPVVR